MIAAIQYRLCLAFALVASSSVGCVEDSSIETFESTILERLDLKINASDLKTLAAEYDRSGPFGLHGTEVWVVSANDDVLEDLYLKMAMSPSLRSQVPSVPFNWKALGVDQVDLVCFVGDADCGCILLVEKLDGTVIVGRWWD